MSVALFYVDVPDVEYVLLALNEMQIVSLGAGMDTRGLRLKASEGTTVRE